MLNYYISQDGEINMFPYHNRLKQLLKTKEYYVIKESGKFAYRFVFPSENKSMPIREYRVTEYLEYIPDEMI